MAVWHAGRALPAAFLERPMNAKYLWIAGLVAGLGLGFAVPAIRAQSAVDGGKRIIEGPTKKLIANGAAPAAKPVATPAELEAVRRALEARLLDVRKGSIENPAKAVIAAPAPPRVDAPKSVAEQPARDVVSRTAAILARHGFTTPPAKAAPPAAPANPKVVPGKVRWHASFADAASAAQRSGKPVLLFQMLGKLDDQFC
jgi:hypothetical protein